MTDRYEKIRQALEMGPTPGPWSIRETATHVTVIGADNEVLFHDDKRLPRVIADARLIAACGPDTIRELLEERDSLAAENARLREALKDAEVKQGELLAALEGMEKWASSIYDGYPPSTASIAAAPYREAARAAIAKATGGAA